MTKRRAQEYVVRQPILLALVECIRDARPPRSAELEDMSELLWHDGLARSSVGQRGHARLMAEAALCGNHLLQT